MTGPERHVLPRQSARYALTPPVVIVWKGFSSNSIQRALEVIPAQEIVSSFVIERQSGSQSAMSGPTTTDLFPPPNVNGTQVFVGSSGTGVGVAVAPLAGVAVGVAVAVVSPPPPPFGPRISQPKAKPKIRATMIQSARNSRLLAMMPSLASRPRNAARRPHQRMMILPSLDLPFRYCQYL